MRFLALLLFVALTAGCGGNPTGPTAVVNAPSSSTTTGDTGPTAPPAPPAPGPAPTPTPPSPTPVPTPTPAPEQWRGTAVVEQSHWYQTPPLPSDRFDVQWSRETVTFGSMTSSVLAWNEKDGTVGLFARPNGMNLQIVFNLASGRGTWSVSGQAGLANGTVTVAK